MQPCHPQPSQSKDLATEISMKLPAAALATLVSSLAGANVAMAADFAPPPQVQQQTQAPSSFEFAGASNLTAPAVKSEYQLPEGTQWRYSEFIGAVENGKVERVRFSKDGTQLQLTAVDGRRATVVLPNDPDLVDILAKNGVDISVSEGDQQGNYVALLGNILFPLIAFGGLFFLFRRAQNGQGESVGPRPCTPCMHPSALAPCFPAPTVILSSASSCTHRLNNASFLIMPSHSPASQQVAILWAAAWVAPWSLAAASPSSRRCLRLV
jgi:hypothetical protein